MKDVLLRKTAIELKELKSSTFTIESKQKLLVPHVIATASKA